MENIAPDSKGIARKKLVYPVMRANNTASSNAEETNAITLILIALAMLALTFAVAIKIVAMVVKPLIHLAKNCCSWLHFQH